MVNNNSTGNISKLRFPGFIGEWEEKTLGDVCDSILVGFPFKGQDITDDDTGHPILRAFSIGEGVIRHGKDYDKYYPDDTTSLEKYKVKDGDIVISMDGSVGKNIAMVSKTEEDYLLIQRVARLRIVDYPKQLIYQQISSQRFKDYAAGEKVGAVISHISQKQIESFPVYVPSTPSEQQKIASCLSELDDLISAQDQKVVALKEKKKGLMQQLFPQPGETIPRLRFPGFTGDWEEKKLGEVCERITDKVGCLVLEPISVSAGIGIISQKQRFGKDISGVQYKNYIHIKKGDYCYNKGNSKRFPQGCIYELKGFNEAAAPNAFISFRFYNTVCPHFFNGYFENNVHGKQLAKYITSGVRADGLLNLNVDDFFKIKFFVPPILLEQQKIAECLSSLDDNIAAEADKLEALKNHKKGLMQQLFPQPTK